MDYPYWTILVAVLLPYIWSSLAAYYKYKMDGKIDVNTPREQSARLDGAGKRANAAQSNAWEALGVYSACFLTAVVAGVEADQIKLLAILWVVFRVLHGASYVADIAKIRMFSFAAGMVCNILIVTKAF